MPASLPCTFNHAPAEPSLFAPTAFIAAFLETLLLCAAKLRRAAICLSGVLYWAVLTTVMR